MGIFDFLKKKEDDQPVLFFALSREQYDMENNTSIPLISTKDFGGVPALYVFTDVNIATGWMQHYRFITDDMKYGLIGAISKEEAEKMMANNIEPQLGFMKVPAIPLTRG